MLNQVVVVGRLVKDPELRKSENTLEDAFLKIVDEKEKEINTENEKNNKKENKQEGGKK